MRRRDVIALLGGATFAPAVLPRAGSAQQRTPVVGFLHVVSANSLPHFVAAFRRGLGEAGYVEGQNVAIEYRWADGRVERLPELAADLAGRRVDVIVTPGNTGTTLAAKAATSTIPIVFAVPDDPVKLGLIASLSRPGGNLTGVNYFTAELVAKRLGLLRELVPRAARLALLVNPADAANAETTVRDVEAAVPGLGLQVKTFNARTAEEIDAAFSAIAAERHDALFVAPGAFFNSRRVQLATLAARHAIPAAYSVRGYVDAGGLMSYGTSIPDAFRQTGVFAGRILKGEKPADMPVVQATKFEFALNLRTARALGIEISPSMLARVDEAIE